MKCLQIYGRFPLRFYAIYIEKSSLALSDYLTVIILLFQLDNKPNTNLMLSEVLGGEI